MLDRALSASAPPWRIARFAVSVALGLAAVQGVFRLSPGHLVSGVAVGSLYGLIAAGIILIYRTNRIINFAAAAIGAVPAIFALTLTVQRGVPYLVALPIAMIGGPTVGALVDVVIMRRFARSTRLVATVVTLGLAQTFAAIGFFIPVWLSARAGDVPLVPTPWTGLRIENARGHPILTGNQVAAIVVALAIIVGLTLFLRRSRIGISLRAASEDGDRAALLGVPVKTIQTAAWAIAGFLSAMAIYFQSPLIGIPGDATLGFDALLYGLAAAVLARMERLGTALTVGVFAGIIEFGVVANTGKSSQVGAVMLVLILGGLLLQRGSRDRAQDAGASSWDMTANFRPVPIELRNLRELVLARASMLGIGAVLAVALPFVVPHAELAKLVLLPLYGIVAVSLVVLTGWGGQVSLGQFGIVGVAAAVSGGLAYNHGADFFIAVLAGIGSGVVVALAIGLPALRVGGLYLAVITLGFAYAAHGYLLDPGTTVGSVILPDGIVTTFGRPLLFERIDLESDRAYYFLCLAGFILSVLAANAFRRNRSGRMVIAARDNTRAAGAYGIHVVRTRLAAFAVSGGIAGLAGALFAYAQHQVIPGTYQVLQSIFVFLAAVIGGLTSLPAAVFAVVAFQAFTLFGFELYAWLGQDVIDIMPLLLTGPLLVLNLYRLPGGLAEVFFGARDRILRRVAAAHGLQVPTLGTDSPQKRGNGHANDGASRAAMEPPSRVPDLVGAPDEPLLSCRDVHVSYGKVNVLFGIDLDVRRNEIVALLGTNGAGKSTLLKAITGLVDVQQGSIRFNGSDITDQEAAITARLGVVMVPGGKGVFPNLTVEEHFTTAAWLFDADEPPAVQRRTDEVLGRFPRLADRWNELAGNLSGGEQQQLALGLAFVARPSLLVIDELSLALAPSLIEQLLDMVREIHALGCTVILVEQSINVALTIADRAYFMEKGEIRFSGPTHELLQRDDIVRAVFLRGPDDVTVPDAPPVEVMPDTVGRATASPETVLEVEGIAKRFGGIKAVDTVSFSLVEGRTLGLIGPNGAGKTTIFDLLSGHLSPDSGIVHCRGADITHWSPARRAHLGLGRSFQDARLFPSLTVAENIALALERHLTERDHLAALLNLPAMQEQERHVAYSVEDLVELLHLGGYRDRFVQELSTGSRRIVDLAMAVALDPTVLLLDEPSSGIAQRESEALAGVLRRVQRETGCALLIIEHDMPLISAVSDEIVALDQGRSLVRGTPEMVLSDPLVVQSYLGGDIDVIKRSGKTRRGSAAGTCSLGASDREVPLVTS